jgi:hypothetical protein
MPSRLSPNYSCVLRKGKILHAYKWDEVKEEYIVLWETGENTQALRTIVVQAACDGISTEALQAGYIQALQQLEPWLNDFMDDRNA